MTNAEFDIYTAGIFDGEGSINIIAATKPHRSWCVSCVVKLTNSQLVSELKENYGGNTGEKASYRKAGYKPQYYWQVRSSLAMNFLHRIYPYLIIKKKEAEVAFAFEQTMLVQRGNNRLTKEQKDLRTNLKAKLEGLR